MQFSIIHQQEDLDDATRGFVERRLLFALSRFGDRIERVSVAISEINTPLGATETSCCVVVTIARLESVTITTADVDVSSAVARAADRVGRAVARTIEVTQRESRSPRFFSK